jgi:hypothetical protein
MSEANSRRVRGFYPAGNPSPQCAVNAGDALSHKGRGAIMKVRKETSLGAMT